MFEVGQRVFQTQLKIDGVVESFKEGRVIIRFNRPDGQQGPHRSVYGPEWLQQNPYSIVVSPMNPPFHAHEIEELEG
jgi:hypothetical protein